MGRDLDSILVKMYQKGKSSLENEFHSCIVTILEVAYKVLPKCKEELANSHLIFLTDQVEQCPESGGGGIYMCNKYKVPVFEEIIAQVKNGYHPDFDLSEKFRVNQIHVVITSSYGNETNCFK